MQRPRPRAATRFGRGRLNVITRRLIQITFRDWRGDISSRWHGGDYQQISLQTEPAVPAKLDRRPVRRVLSSQYVE